MNTKYYLSPRFLVITTTIVIAAVFRLLPHWPNFTPVAAIALFGGASFSRKHIAIIVPLAAMFLSDLIIGFHNYMWAVYAGFLLTVVLGMSIGSKPKVLPVLGMVSISSALFFLLTNFAVWLGSPFYAQNLTGLLSSYVAGLPFFFNSLAGNVFYAGALFGSFYLVQQRYPRLREVFVRNV